MCNMMPPAPCFTVRTVLSSCLVFAKCSALCQGQKSCFSLIRPENLCSICLPSLQLVFWPIISNGSLLFHKARVWSVCEQLLVSELWISPGPSVFVYGQMWVEKEISHVRGQRLLTATASFHKWNKSLLGAVNVIKLAPLSPHLSSEQPQELS